jgi:predicted nucleic acid-binding protein
VSVFADSSSLVKLYADEAGAEQVRALPRPLYVSLLARVEVPAALWRKHRTKALTADETAELVAAFAADFPVEDETEPRFHTIGISRRIIDRL